MGRNSWKARREMANLAKKYDCTCDPLPGRWMFPGPEHSITCLHHVPEPSNMLLDPRVTCPFEKQALPTATQQPTIRRPSPVGPDLEF